MTWSLEALFFSLLFALFAAAFWWEGGNPMAIVAAIVFSLATAGWSVFAWWNNL